MAETVKLDGAWWSQGAYLMDSRTAGLTPQRHTPRRIDAACCGRSRAKSGRH